MIRIFLLITLTISANGVFGQSAVEKKYPKTLWASTDSFTVSFSNFPGFVTSFRVSERDTIDMGSDGASGVYAKIYFGTDSIKISYKNLPLDEIYWIDIQSPRGKTVYRLHFNRINAEFSEAYIQENTNKVLVEVPEVYELANIVWTLSPSGQRANNLNTQGAYYDKVIKHFKPYLNHPLFKRLDFKEDEYMKKYYDFRENSFAFSFNNNGKLVWGRPYYYVTGDDRDFNSLFKKLTPLIEDFSRKSNFRSFYKSNLPYYEQLKKQELDLMPVRNMWTWLENEFPTKYQSYKVVFSPLIKSSHSTQNFFNFIDDQQFGQTVMFVSGPNAFDDETVNEKQKEGLASGIVFTEIDHNYVNPATAKYVNQVDSIFSNRSVWVKQSSNSDFYRTAVSVFNEYMTHAVFCLYVLDNYDKATADFIIDRREKLMVNTRNFIKFKEFAQELTRLRQAHHDLKVVDLYPFILTWSRQQL